MRSVWYKGLHFCTIILLPQRSRTGREEAHVSAGDILTSMLKRQTMTEGLTDLLRKAILSGEIPEGTQLRQDAIARQYDVSRIPVREALRQLEAEGLIVSHAHRSSVVASLSLSDIDEIFEIRSILEPHLLVLSLPNLTAADFAAAEAVLTEYDAALAAGDVARWGDLNWRFHGILCGAAGRPQTWAVVNGLQRKIDRYTRMQLHYTDGVVKAQTEHRALLDLCSKGQAADAAAHLAVHIREAGQALHDFLRQHAGKE